VGRDVVPVQKMVLGQQSAPFKVENMMGLNQSLLDVSGIDGVTAELT
jgi:hypothetical protein